MSLKLKNRLFVLAVTLTIFASCGGKVQDKQADAIMAEDAPQEYLVNPDACVSVSILKTDAINIALSEEDTKIVLAYLNSGVYNKERNDSGIKYKMAGADYTFLIGFKDGRKGMVQYWVESALILLDAKWYNPISAANIQDSLNKYFK